MNKNKEVDNYISNYPEIAQKLLQQLRLLIQKTVPKAKEVISYQIPAYSLNDKIVIYFAGYQNHIGLYPTPSGVRAFKKEIKGFKHSKGAVQFPIDQPLPVDLIRRIVEFRVGEVIDNKS